MKKNDTLEKLQEETSHKRLGLMLVKSDIRAGKLVKPKRRIIKPPT